MSRIRPLIARAAAAAALALGGVALPVVAQAEPIHQFSFQLNDVTRDGSFTAVFSSRAFDTTGAPPAPMEENTVRLPAGVTVRRQFLRPSYYCDGRQLIDAVTAGKPYAQSWVSGFRRIGPVLRRLARLGTRADRRLIGNAQRCTRALVGFGRAVVDARPAIADEIPSDILIYLSRPARGAVATLSIVGIPDPKTPVVRANRILRDVRALVTTSFVNDPSADGRYGYKLVLPVGRVEGIQISVSKLDVQIDGLRIRQPGGGELFWLTRPTCPASGTLSFEAFYGYAPPLTDITRTFSLPCPRYG